MRYELFLLAILGLSLHANASGHGPVFGLAIPTNSQGEWSFDEGAFGRSTDIGTQASVRELVGYGLNSSSDALVDLTYRSGKHELAPQPEFSLVTISRQTWLGVFFIMRPR